MECAVQLGCRAPTCASTGFSMIMDTLLRRSMRRDRMRGRPPVPTSSSAPCSTQKGYETKRNKARKILHLSGECSWQPHSRVAYLEGVDGVLQGVHLGGCPGAGALPPQRRVGVVGRGDGGVAAGGGVAVVLCTPGRPGCCQPSHTRCALGSKECGQQHEQGALVQQGQGLCRAPTVPSTRARGTGSNVAGLIRQALQHAKRRTAHALQGEAGAPPVAAMSSASNSSLPPPLFRECPPPPPSPCRPSPGDNVCSLPEEGGRRMVGAEGMRRRDPPPDR